MPKSDAALEIIDMLQAARLKSAIDPEWFNEMKKLYVGLEKGEKETLFQGIIAQMEISQDDLKPTLERLAACPQNDPSWPRLMSRFRNDVRSPRLQTFKKIALSPGGLKFLLDFRGDILSIARHSGLDFMPLDADIVFLFEMWFQEGFLYLEEITLNSAYRQIALIKDRDLVHPMASIEEMGQRLGRDRRCFALYHRLMPYEPIVFIEVAITRGIAGSMSQVLTAPDDRTAEARADTAVFYSINSTQNGLSGLGMGKMLIGKVVEYLKNENPKLKNFVTLSPMPGFWERYLKPLLEGKDTNFSMKQDDVADYFSKRAVRKILGQEENEFSADTFRTRLLALLENGAWVHDEALRRDFKMPLTRIAYHYIAHEKSPRNRPLNPVANFHLGNGAAVYQRNVHFLANPSQRGIRESCGIMVNYIYTLSWLGQIRGSFGWFDRLEIRGLFGKTL